MRLKILSLWQPHATLCVTPSLRNPEVPAKPIETRGWPTSHRGWLGIHAAVKKDKFFRSLCQRPSFKKYIPDFDALPFGCITGMVKISGCYPTDSDQIRDFMLRLSGNRKLDEVYADILSFGDFSENRFGFMISDFVQFSTPIKARGGQGFWYYEMPNHITEYVGIKDGGDGIVIDYDEKRRHPYLVKHGPDLDETRVWYGEIALIFTGISALQSKELPF